MSGGHRHSGLFVPGGSEWIVLLPGFQIPARAYRDVADAIAARGPTVFVPQLVAPGPLPLLGRPDVRTEAVRGAATLSALRAKRSPSRVVLAGHSRGGLAAWLIAAHVALDGLALIDPVDASGPRPRTPHFTVHPLRAAFPVLVIGAGIEGRCAPSPVGHRAFAAATEGCNHIVLPDLGHSDILSRGWRGPGARLCGGGRDPEAAIRTVADLICGALSR
jgi:alpha-beta hydrolase superfamily lysophospholipase